MVSQKEYNCFVEDKKEKYVYYSGKEMGGDKRKMPRVNKRDLLKAICCVIRLFLKSPYGSSKGDRFMYGVSTYCIYHFSPEFIIYMNSGEK